MAIILDTNPAAWSLLSATLSFSQMLSNLLVFINAHLAANYTNKVAVIASHCNKAQWVYPTPTEQRDPIAPNARRRARDADASPERLSEHTKRLKLNGPRDPESQASDVHGPRAQSNKYRPFRLVEEEVVHSLTTLLATTSPSDLSHGSSTMMAGALTLALSYINRETDAYNASLSGPGRAGMSDPPDAALDASTMPGTGALESRILLVSVSPSTDLAHQYIPIMNAIFACQRRSIPIDILQLPLPLPLSSSSLSSSSSSTLPSPAPQVSSSSTKAAPSTQPPPAGSSASTSPTSTAFLQQASDATHGIFIAHPPAATGPAGRAGPTPTSVLQYLFMCFLSPPSSRVHLVLPTRVDVDFRAACFCHRDIVSQGYVCSICLSIFCAVPPNQECLTCGTKLDLAADVQAARRPAVVRRGGGGGAGGAGGRSGNGSGGAGPGPQPSPEKRKKRHLLQQQQQQQQQ